MNMNFIKTLSENWLFRSRTIAEFTLRDIADLAFLYLICLHILRSEYETAATAIGYAKITNSHSGYKSLDRTSTDLYQFLNILSNPSQIQLLANRDANNILWEELNFNSNTVRQFLDNISKKKYEASKQKSLLFQIENQLYINVSNYKSMRRIAVDWHSQDVDTAGQRMVITRLLQAFRARAKKGDLMPWLERLNNLRQYELSNVCDPETGKGCHPEKPVISIKNNKMSFFKTLALGALAGGVITNAMSRKKK